MANVRGNYNEVSHAVPVVASQVIKYGVLFQGNRQTVLLRADLLMVIMTILDRWVVGQVLLSFFSLVSMLMVGSVRGRRQFCAIAALCTPGGNLQRFGMESKDQHFS